MKTTYLTLGLFAVAAAICTPSIGRAQITVGNSDSGGSNFGFGGLGFTQGIGDWVQAPGTELTTVLFVEKSQAYTGSTLTFFVAAWSGTASSPIGTVLYQDTITPVVSGSPTVLTFTPNVNVTSGSTYLLGLYDTSGGGGVLSLGSSSNPATGSDLGYVYDSTNPGSQVSFTADNWTSVPAVAPLTMQATFTGVSAAPELSHFALAGIGLCLGLAAYQYRRRKFSSSPEMPVAAA
jgi:hypothetical protein